MEDYKKEFIEFMVQSGVLTFGDFITKSGRSTPFFINTGNYDSGEQMERLGYFYAKTIVEKVNESDIHLFGPAYKGIPLVVTTSIALNHHFKRNHTFTFNRKEVKDHGEGGSLVGYQVKDGDRIVILEDVTTSGASIRETVPQLQAQAKLQLEALVVSVDRMEKGRGKLSALAELEEEYGLKSFPIVNLDDVVAHLHNREINGTVVLNDDRKIAIEKYREKYGI